MNYSTERRDWRLEDCVPERDCAPESPGGSTYPGDCGVKEVSSTPVTNWAGNVSGSVVNSGVISVSSSARVKSTANVPDRVRSASSPRVEAPCPSRATTPSPSRIVHAPIATASPSPVCRPISGKCSGHAAASAPTSWVRVEFVVLIENGCFFKFGRKRVGVRVRYVSVRWFFSQSETMSPIYGILTI